jgi:Raf kinase inhibitor-like YbhB/YbcL family protein
MRPALPSQNGSVSTTSPPTSPAIEDDFFDTVAPDPVAPGGPIEVSTTVLGSDTIARSVLNLTVTAPWRNGAAIDPRYTCKGANVSPALTWTDAPEGTQEIAITLIDQDADFDHWTMTGIAPDITGLAENTPPEGAVAARNGAGASGYTGPCPPAGATHTYRLTVHYLNTALLMTSGGSAADMRAAIDDTTLATAQVSGTFTGT